MYTQFFIWVFCLRVFVLINSLVIYDRLNMKSNKNDEYIKAFYENRKSKNFAILGIIIFMVVLFFFITILRMDVTA